MACEGHQDTPAQSLQHVSASTTPDWHITVSTTKKKAKNNGQPGDLNINKHFYLFFVIDEN